MEISVIEAVAALVVVAAIFGPALFVLCIDDFSFEESAEPAPRPTRRRAGF